MWSALATALGAVLTTVLGLVRASHRSGVGKRLKYHAELASAAAIAPEAQAELKVLLLAEAKELRAREERRLARHLNPYNVVLAFLLTGGGAVGVYYLVQWVFVAGTWQWVAVLVTVIVGLFVLLLALASFSTIYNPQRE